MLHPLLLYAGCVSNQRRSRVSSRRSFLKHCSTAGRRAAVEPQRSALSAMTHAMATQPNTLNVSTLAPFVDPLPIPAVAKSSGMRPLPSSPKTNVPYYRLGGAAHRREDPSRSEADAVVGDSAVRCPARRWRCAAAKRFWSSGRTSFRSNTSCPSTIACTEPRAIRRCASSPTCTAVLCRRRATVIPKTGIVPGQVAHLSLSNQAGRGDALVSRSRHGHQSPEHLCRPVRRGGGARQGRGRAQLAQRQLRNSADDLRPPHHAGGPTVLSDLR